MNLNFERKLWKEGFKNVVGLDEAGRGALAGPVVAAAVMINPKKIKNLKLKRSKIRDSKELSPKEREIFFEVLLKDQAIEWATSKVSEKVIDKINILEATKLAMKRAVKKLEKKGLKIDFLILDGNFKINLKISQKSIVKADKKIFSCALSSILAKVFRDKIMLKYHKKYPQYRFDLHKGYPTKFHFEMLKKYGFCKIHRKSFCKNLFI